MKDDNAEYVMPWCHLAFFVLTQTFYIAYLET